MKKATIFGASGMLGSALLEQNPGYEIFSPASKHANLALEKPTSQHNDLWILSAAKVGGVAANTAKVADFYSDNIKIATNTLEAAAQQGVQKVVSVLSTCIYPDARYVTYPLTEDQLHNGPPHESNFGYAYAKRMLEVQSRALRRQHGHKFVCVVPNNLYGLNDNYDLNDGHVIPSLIRKFYEAHLEKRDVVIWGDGTPLREFTLSSDVARIIWWLAENYDGEEPINVGSTEEISIAELSSIIAGIIGFKGDVIFDAEKPKGQHKKPTSNQKLRSLGCNLEYTPIKIGLDKVINDFIKKYPHHRGIGA